MLFQLLCVVAVCSAFEPVTVKFENLFDLTMSHVIKKELVNTGMIGISNIPEYKDLQKAVLNDALLCSKQSTSSAKTSTFADGTVLSTLATKTTYDGGAESFSNGNHVDCDAFDQSSRKFRKLIDKVSGAFVSSVSSVFGVNVVPFLGTKDHNRSYHSIYDVVTHGDKLEHFHAFTAHNRTRSDGGMTVDFHTDQGFFIAFTPALLVRENGQTAPDTTGEFYVQLSDHSRHTARFDSDTLIFMFGDGVDQYINSKLPESDRIRAMPHALVMREQEPGETRVWYGRMFLPPPEAVSETHGVTYRKLRELVIDASVQENKSLEATKVLSLGCSRRLFARQLQQTDCAENEMFCWMRCMPETPEANPSACAEKGLKYACTSQHNQLWRPVDSHGDYNPMCTSATSWVTKAPTFAPAPADKCSSANFAEFAGLGQYQGFHELWEGKAVLLWSVTDDGEVDAKLAYNGRVGWLGFGFTNNADSLHGGMLGGRVVMGIRSESEEVAANEYHINPKLTAFRHWSDPLPSSLADSAMIVDDCFSALTFKGKALAGQDFNMDGPNELMWGVHTTTYLVGYHGRNGMAGGDRSKMRINFRRSAAEVLAPTPAHTWATEHKDEGDHGDSAAHTAHTAHATNCHDTQGHPCDPNRRRLLFGGAKAAAACVCN